MDYVRVGWCCFKYLYISLMKKVGNDLFNRCYFIFCFSLSYSRYGVFISWING